MFFPDITEPIPGDVMFAPRSLMGNQEAAICVEVGSRARGCDVVDYSLALGTQVPTHS